MIVTKFDEVKKIYEYAAENKWVMPCICTENQTTTEAILAAASEYGKKVNKKIPIIIAITVNYSHRPQARNYSYCEDWKTGLKLFKDDIEAFAGKGGKYEDVIVLTHLDHVQFDDDLELINSNLEGEYSSIMYDASALPFEENIKSTAAFVKRMKGKILIEGACDEIVDATGDVHNALTTPESAKRFLDETNVDLMVANLGTEHRASGKELMYHGDLAREIKKVVGEVIVLHGTSSVKNDQIKTLWNDGICKVNIWTALERDSSGPLFKDMVKNASKVAGPDVIDELIKEGYLTEKCRTGDKINLAFFTNKYRQAVIFDEMKRIVNNYLELWYV